MACKHKFFGHQSHLQGINGLLPNWNVKTLIIGTFNPEEEWHPTNTANYYYGRDTSLFWDVLPRFACINDVDRQDIDGQIDFLKDRQIGITDILISIDDASLDNDEDVLSIQTVKDDLIEQFGKFTWNTMNIIEYIKQNNIEAVYFTKLGDLKRKKAKPNSFEEQIRKIEQLCNDTGIYVNRLHTPSGQGLRSGKPRVNVLINRWYHMNGGHLFPFISKDFDIRNFPISYD